MGNDRDDNALNGDSWTDVEQSPPHEQLEFVPVRRGMVLAERWAIEEVLGQGGMGIVVRARDRALGVTVAIKIVRAELAGDRSWAERLAREVKLARQIHHRNVCRVFDFGQDVARVFLVMELSTKGTLRDELRAREPYAARPLAERLADARAVAEGLAAIHAAGIVHRDVSPQNVLRMDDGRLVVSDFGLATDDVDSTTSIHGGTIAYMAPELVRGGGRASMASDVWALGVVIHEIVFGEKPTWREPVGSDMRQPSLGRPLAPPERAAFEIARVCMAADPGQRAQTAAEVARMLGERALPRRAWRARTWARALTVAGVVVGTVAAGSLWLGARRAPGAANLAPTEQSPLIVPSGSPTDWTEKSVVLAEVPERIYCTSLLPDQKTIRFVWGSPKRAEDVDTVTRRRVPSPLVPQTFAEGCPDVSPDGKRIVFTGHAPDKRPFAFVSERADGSAAVPVVPIAEPTMNSDPTWMADSQSFSYEADVKHMGAFSLQTNRAIVLPQATSRPFLGAFHHVVRDQIVVTAARFDGQAEVVGFGWPSVEEQVRFRSTRPILDVQSRDGRTYYGTTPAYEASTPLLAIEPASRRSRLAAIVRDQLIRYPRFVAHGLTFVSIRMQDIVSARAANGRWKRLASDSSITRAVPCGPGFAVALIIHDQLRIARVEAGTVITVSDGPLDNSPACSSDGRVLFYIRQTSSPVIQRCDASGCSAFASILAGELAVSPDGERLALLMVENRGPMVRWMSTRGGPLHDIVETETVCRPGWSSNRTLWVSRREGEKVVWTEVEADGGRPTGKRLPGSRDCADGGQDPASPVDPEIRVVNDRRSQLRFLPEKYLEESPDASHR